MSTVNATNFLTGLLVGGTMGALAALLCAPQQGPAWRAIRQRQWSSNDTDPRIDDEMDQSFPASDPPSWTSATTGSTR
jgi:gas vesicle protein